MSQSAKSNIKSTILERVNTRFSRLRSKLFCGVREQRKAEKGDFQYFACSTNGARAKKKKDGGRLPPSYFTRSIYRPLIDSITLKQQKAFLTAVTSGRAKSKKTRNYI